MAMRTWRVGLAEMHRSVMKSVFVKDLQKLIPEVRSEDLTPGGAGVRAQAVSRDGALLDDFSIQETPGAIHVLNAPSPGATSSLSIGAHIAHLAGNLLQPPSVTPPLLPHTCEGPPLTLSLSKGQGLSAFLLPPLPSWERVGVRVLPLTLAPETFEQPSFRCPGSDARGSQIQKCRNSYDYGSDNRHIWTCFEQLRKGLLDQGRLSLS